MSEYDPVLQKARLAQFFSACETVDSFQDPHYPADDRILAWTVLTVASMRIAEKDSTHTPLNVVVSNILQANGADIEQAAAFTEKHITRRGAAELCRRCVEMRPATRGIVWGNRPRNWSGRPDDIISFYLDTIHSRD